MTRLHDLSVRVLLLFAAALMVAVAPHAGVWYIISRHLGVTGAVASALIALAVVKHLGWIGGHLPCSGDVTHHPGSRCGLALAYVLMGSRVARQASALPVLL